VTAVALVTFATGAENVEDRAEKGQATPPAGQVSGSDRRRRLRRNAKLFRALGHESRLMILTILETGEHCVCDLAEETGLDQSTVSKHLALLAGNELVDSERRRHHVYYRLTAPWVTELLRAHPGAPAELE